MPEVVISIENVDLPSRIRLAASIVAPFVHLIRRIAFPTATCEWRQTHRSRSFCDRVAATRGTYVAGRVSCLAPNDIREGRQAILDHRRPFAPIPRGVRIGKSNGRARRYLPRTTAVLAPHMRTRIVRHCTLYRCSHASQEMRKLLAREAGIVTA